MKEYGFDEMTVGSILEDKAKTNKGRIAARFKDITVTYDELNDTANRVANSLSEIGVKKGDMVCMMLPNCLEYLYVWFGLAKIGAVKVPINTAYKGDLLEYIINNCDAEIIVIDQQYLSRLKFIESGLPRLKKVIICPGATGKKSETPDMKFEDIPYDRLLDSPPTTPMVEIKHTDPVAILYTSGTTGPSKGVVMSHAHFYYYSRQAVKYLGLRSDDILYTVLPLFHINAQGVTAFGAILVDTQFALGDRFSASKYWDEIKKYNATQFDCLGAMLNILCAQPKRDDDADNPVRLCFTAPIPVEVYDEFRTRFNLEVVEGYGATESNLILCNPLDAPKLGSMGRVTEGFECIIVDDDDNELPTGETGELLIRHNVPFSMMSEYYNMPDKTVEAWRNLWFHSGDRAYVDEEGYYYFVDRKKEAIRRRGENISSFEVERVVNKHPKVVECACVPAKSEFIEDEVKIVVVLKERETLPPEELIAFCEDRMAYFAIPRYVEYVGSLPKTLTEKVEKYKLIQEGVNENTWDRVEAGYRLKR